MPLCAEIITCLKNCFSLQRKESFMKNPIRMTLLALLVLLPFLAGCAGNKTRKEMNVLHAQIAAITDELVRLDESIIDMRSAVAQGEARLSELKSSGPAVSGSTVAAGAGVSLSGGTYRTPSGFELPALEIQRALKNAGYYQGALDGKIGSGTRQALMAFQKDNGLTPDGICGRNTWSKLKVYGTTVK